MSLSHPERVKRVHYSGKEKNTRRKEVINLLQLAKVCAGLTTLISLAIFEIPYIG